MVGFSSAFLLDTYNQYPTASQLERCSSHKLVWDSFRLSDIDTSFVCGSIDEALQAISASKLNDTRNYNVLVTGSLHLVGNTLGLIM